MWCWLPPPRARYLAGLPAARSRSVSVTPLRLLRRGESGPGRVRRRGPRDPGEMSVDEPLERQIRFVLEADRLKTVARQSRITDGTRPENSAEHSWHLALMALALGGHAPAGPDLGRVMAMVVVQARVEIDAGDLFQYADRAAQARQEAAERAAADRIFALLPVPQAAAARALWDEFEERRTPEARFARALDRLQPMLLNMQTGGGTWVAHDVPLDQVLSRVKLVEEGSAALGGYAKTMIAQAVERGFLRTVAGPHAG